MKTIIYAFSGTGTSLAIARTICDALGNTEVVMIPKALRNADGDSVQPDADAVGFVFPNYFGGVPQAVSDFVKMLDLSETAYVFAVVTAGGGQGYSLKFLERKLAEKGHRLDYGKYIRGVSNYIVGWYYTLICSTGEQRANVLRRLDEQAKRFAADIASRKKDIERSKLPVYMINRLLSKSRIIEDTRCWDKEFSVSDRCVGCNVCENICQFSNIKMKNGKPEFQHNCQRCLACIQYCPRQAIGFKGKPLTKPRYFHPDYPAKEMIRVIHKDS